MDIVEKLNISNSKEIWNTLLEKYPAIMPFSSFEWYNAWVFTHGQDGAPYLLHSGDSIAPFIRFGDQIRFAYYGTDNLDIIGSKKDCWPQFLDYAKKDGVKEVLIEKIPEGSETVSFFTQFFLDNPSQGQIEKYDTTPILELPVSFDEYLARPEMKPKRRKYNKFERENPTVQVVDSTNIEEDMDTLLFLMDKIDFKKESNSPQREAFFREIARVCRDNMWLQLLKVDGKVIAAQVMFLYKDEVLLYISGHEGDMYPNVGTFLIMSAIKQSIERGFKKFNFLKGSEIYKYELGAQDSPLYKITLSL